MSALITKKRILVTGARGFLGSYFSKELNKNNYVRVNGLKTFIPLKEVYDYNLTDFSHCKTITKDIDYVFHFASKSAVLKSSAGVKNSTLLTNNILVNTNMINACIENGVRKLFFPSSLCTYPKSRQQKNQAALKEIDQVPADPDGYYGWEKLFTEVMLEAFQKDFGMQIKIIRPESIYGPGENFIGDKAKFIPSMCRKVIEAKDGGEIEIWGDGTQLRSICFIEDLFTAASMLMESDVTGAFNVGSNEPHTVNEIADMLIKISGKTITKKNLLNEAKSVDVRLTDTSKIKNAIGWEHKTKLEDGLRMTYNWIKGEMK